MTAQTDDFTFTAPRGQMYVTSKDGLRRVVMPNTDANFHEAFCGRFAWGNYSDGKIYEALSEEAGLAWLKAERETYRRQCAEKMAWLKPVAPERRAAA